MSKAVYGMKRLVRKGKYSQAAIRLLKGLSRRVDALIVHACWMFPVNDRRIVFQSDIDYWDNTRTFSDFLVSQGLDSFYDIVWMVDKPEAYHPKGELKFVKKWTLLPNPRSDFIIATAKLAMFTHGVPAGIYQRRPYPQQTYMLTTHSASQLKRSFDRITRKRYDFILCCGRDAYEKRFDAWDLREGQLPILGMPRLDLMYRHRDCLSILYPERSGKRLVLAMETFKKSERYDDSSVTESYGLNVIRGEDELESLDALLGSKGAVLVIKTHHMQDMSYLRRLELTNVLFLTDEEMQARGVQLNEFLENADLLLTDYSSVYYDFLLVDRPIGFMVADIDEYTRGFASDDPLSEMPGAIIEDAESLMEFIGSSLAGKDGFSKERARVRDLVFARQGPGNCRRLLEWLQSNGLLPTPEVTDYVE